MAEQEILEQEETIITPQNEDKSFKSIWKSKTFYVNLIAMISFLIQHKYGYVVDEAMQMQVLTVVNILLRTISSEGVSWK
jgi:hypothetical protein